MKGLKIIRKERNLNQQKVAIDLNINREALSHYENGKREPSLDMLIKLSDYFNVSIDFLIKGEEFKNDKPNLWQYYIIILFLLLSDCYLTIL